MYLLINGVIEIDKLLEILKTKHGFKIDKGGLLKLVQELPDIKIMGIYICILGLERELVYQTMQYKNLFGSYKIIDKLEEIEQQYNGIVLAIENVCKEFFDDKTACDLIRFVMFLSGINSKVLNTTLKN